MQNILHHVGCLVENIEQALEDYSILFPESKKSIIYNIADQNVKVCFLEVSTNVFIEFVEPLDLESTLAKMKKKGTSFYHIGIYVNNFDDELLRLESMGYRKINEFHSEAFQGKRCSFLYNNELHLVELIEK